MENTSKTGSEDSSVTSMSYNTNNLLQIGAPAAKSRDIQAI